jgi:cytochrome c biogenesis protein CcdA/glutaredoxin
MNKALLALLLFLTMGSLQARTWFALFGSDDCDECAQIKAMWKSRPQPAKDPVLIYICIDKNENYAFLKKIEKELNITRPSLSFPVLLLGQTMIAGLEGFLDEFDNLEQRLGKIPEHPLLQPLQQLANTTDGNMTAWNASRETPAYAQPSSDMAVLPEQKAELLYFLAKGCQKCSRQLRELHQLKEQIPSLQLSCYDVATADGQILLQRTVNHFQIPQGDDNLAPLVAWNHGYVTGRLATAEELAQALTAQAEDKAEPFWHAPISQKERQDWTSRQTSLTDTATIGLVFLAGLFDGLNPCAFATSIFLIGYLLYLKRKPKDIVIVGASFCFGVFLTYLLFGFGLSFLIDFLNSFFWIKTVIYLLFALAALILAVMNIKDGLSYRRTGKTQDMDLGLSLDTHRKIHDRIKAMTAKASTWLMAPAAVVLGTVVSSMELACTGQIYLPTLAAINSQGLDFRATMLLLLYNLAFIIPLVIISILAAMGFGAKRIAAWAKDNLANTKFILAAIFLAIAILMAVFVIREWPSQDKATTASDCLLETTPATNLQD